MVVQLTILLHRLTIYVITFSQPLTRYRVDVHNVMELVAFEGKVVFLKPECLHGNFTILQPNERTCDASCPSAGMGWGGVREIFWVCAWSIAHLEAQLRVSHGLELVFSP